MATLFGGGQQQEQDKDKEQQNQQQAITPIGLAGSGGGVTPAATAPMTGQQQRPASSGTFTNVRQFVDANRGAGTKIADKATSNIAQNVRQASGKVGQVSALGSDVQQEEQRIGRADEVRQAIQSNPLTLTENQDEFNQARQLITGQTAAEQQRQMLQERAGAAAQALQGAQQQVQGLGTESGRFGLLRQAVGGPSYSQGQQRLDQLLFQTEGARQIGQAQRTLGSELAQQTQSKQQAQDELLSRIGQYQTLAGQKAQELGTELGTQKTAIGESTAQERERLVMQRAKENEVLERLLRGNTTGMSAQDQEIMNRLGQDVLGMRTYNLLNDDRYQDYRQQARTDLTNQDVIGQDVFNRYRALADLAGLQESERAFTRVGDAGPEAAILKDRLQEDVLAREQAILQQLNRIGTGTGSAYQSAGRLTVSAGSQANLQDVLRQYEGAIPSANYTDRITGATSGIIGAYPRIMENFFGTDRHAVSGISPGNFGYTELTSYRPAADQARQQILNNLLAELNREGYNQTLGGVTTANTLGITKK